MLVMVAASELETDQVEKWYGTKYSVQEMDPELVKELQENTNSYPTLSLPERNDMIPTDFTLRRVEHAPMDQPTLLQDTDTCRLWYKPDNVFEMPKVNILCSLTTTVAYESPESTVLTSLYTHVLEEHCNEFTYLASMAGLHCSIANSRSGVELHVSGYNHKVTVLIQRVVKTIQDVSEHLTEELFQRLVHKLREQFQSFFFSQPYQHAFYGSDLCCIDRKWTIEEKLRALESCTKQGLVEFSKRLLSRFHLEVLVHGNASPEEAKQMANLVLDGLNPAPLFSEPQTRVVQLSEGTDYVYRFREFNPDNTNHAIKVLYQMGPMELDVNANLALLHHLLREPAFNELRTEEQLGYIVHTSIDTTGDNIKGLLFLIQSDSYDPIHLDARIEAFLERFRTKLVIMSADEFQANVDAVVKNFLEKNKNLGEESTKYWNVVTDHTYLFRKYQMIAEEVGKLDKNAVLRLFDRHLAKGAPRRQKLSVQVFAGREIKSDDENDDKVVLVTDVNEFKRGLRLFPLVKSVDVSPMKFETVVLGQSVAGGDEE
jgi:insulysin